MTMIWPGSTAATDSSNRVWSETPRARLGLQLAEHPGRCRKASRGRVLPEPIPSAGAHAVDPSQEKRHELPGVFDVFDQFPIDVGDNRGERAGQEARSPQKRTDRGHRDGRGDPVAGDVSRRDAQPLLTALVNAEVVAIAGRRRSSR
ncbi:MAG: hypothetical protein MZV70_46325 [Desulfobacterales bacterium]|nr:hypothetical protein [Desulfobacterales bacterium]